MRLAQLARRIGRSQSDIVKFLAQKNISIADDSNAKIDDAHLNLLVAHFAPELALENDRSEEGQAANIITEEPATTFIAPANDDVAVENFVSSENSAVVETVNAPLDDSSGHVLPDLIKAPKIELAGLKVIGKIDLPEVKKKPEQKELSEESIKRELKRDSRVRKESETRLKSEYKNPIALQREKEEKEKQRKKEEAAAYQKELRTQRYLAKVRKPVDVFKDSEEKFVPKKEVKPVTKQKDSISFFGRLKKWFSSAK